jgi:hypothetical protein
MATRAADAVRLKAGEGTFAQFADRWIYVFMAGLFFVTVLVGFIPDSRSMLAAVEAGERPPLPPILHLHAIAMGAWISLLLVQTTLVATGRRAQHRKLGLVAVGLVPVMLFGFVGVVAPRFAALASLPPDAMSPDALANAKMIASNFLLEQSRVTVLFAAFATWALLVRRKDPETHKRLLILATLIPLPAAYDRIEWLYTTMPTSPTTVHLYLLLWLAPALLYDIWRRGSVHRAYVIGIAANLPFIVFSHVAWGAPWWVATAPRLFGIESW